MVPNHQASSITERNLSPGPEKSSSRLRLAFHTNVRLSENTRLFHLAELKPTGLPVSSQRLVVALLQHEEIDHVGHVVVPERRTQVISMSARPYTPKLIKKNNNNNLLT